MPVEVSAKPAPPLFVLFFFFFSELLTSEGLSINVLCRIWCDFLVHCRRIWQGVIELDFFYQLIINFIEKQATLCAEAVSTELQRVLSNMTNIANRLLFGLYFSQLSVFSQLNLKWWPFVSAKFNDDLGTPWDLSLVCNLFCYALHWLSLLFLKKHQTFGDCRSKPLYECLW